MTHQIKQQDKTSEARFYQRYADDRDCYGFNVNTIKKWDPFFHFFYRQYFNVKVVGLDNFPKEGGAVLVGNHSGVLPVDAFMLFEAMLHEHSDPRRIRFLSHNFLRESPIAKEIVCGFGGIEASYAAAIKELERGELVFFYPEGARGTGKPYSMRYRLNDFDPGFVKAAIATGSPIIPITTIGGDEIYPLLANCKTLARFLGAPYWPITATYPWLPFPANCLPIPVKFLIQIGKPIHLDIATAEASNRRLRLKLCKEVQYEIQRQINALLRTRKSPFSDWQLEAL